MPRLPRRHAPQLRRASCRLGAMCRLRAKSCRARRVRGAPLAGQPGLRSRHPRSEHFHPAARVRRRAPSEPVAAASESWARRSHPSHAVRSARGRQGARALVLRLHRRPSSRGLGARLTRPQGRRAAWRRVRVHVVHWRERAVQGIDAPIPARATSVRRTRVMRHPRTTHCLLTRFRRRLIVSGRRRASARAASRRVPLLPRRVVSGVTSCSPTCSTRSASFTS